MPFKHVEGAGLAHRLQLYFLKVMGHSFWSKLEICCRKKYFVQKVSFKAVHTKKNTLTNKKLILRFAFWRVRGVFRRFDCFLTWTLANPKSTGFSGYGMYRFWCVLIRFPPNQIIEFFRFFFIFFLQKFWVDYSKIIVKINYWGWEEFALVQNKK